MIYLFLKQLDSDKGQGRQSSFVTAALFTVGEKKNCFPKQAQYFLKHVHLNLFFKQYITWEHHQSKADIGPIWESLRKRLALKY